MGFKTREEKIAYDREYYYRKKAELEELKQSNPEKYVELFEKNKRRQKRANRWYYGKNKEKEKKRAKEDYHANREERRATHRAWTEENKEWLKQKSIEYRKTPEAKALRCACQAKRDANKLNATPAWLTKEHHDEIKEMYILAKELQWLFEGDPLHVDHIVPLKGKKVCGLHVPWNLQLLPAKLNIKKNNKLENPVT